MNKVYTELTLNVENKVVIESDEYFGLLIRNLYPINLSRFIEKPMKIDIKIEYDDENKIIFNILYNNKYIFYSSLDTFYYNLLSILEDYCTNLHNGIAMHGSGIVFNNYAYLFCQSRKRGKSTLVCDLLSDLNCLFLSDDVLFFRNEYVCGLTNPIRLRKVNIENVKKNGRICCETLGEEKIFIYIPDNNFNYTYRAVDKIFFIEYDININNECIKLMPTNSFFNLIKNVRKKINMEYLYKWASNFLKDHESYVIKYNNINYAREIISKLINN
ncbi:hypothetical protein ACAG39_09305 [Caldicellulosiruptoraceae bacterium PP1]